MRLLASSVPTGVSLKVVEETPEIVDSRAEFGVPPLDVVSILSDIEPAAASKERSADSSGFVVPSL